MTLTLRQIAQMVNGTLVGNPECTIEGVGPIESAGEKHITFAEKKSALKELDQVKAAAIIVPPGVRAEGRHVIQTTAPRLAFTKIMAHFHPPRHPRPGIDATAVMGADCHLGSGVSIGANAVIGNRVTLDDGCIIHPLVVIGDDVSIGAGSIIHPHVAVLEGCRIGQRCLIGAGSIIGSDGYGFVQDEGRHFKIPQTGMVCIDDDVEIGAANTIDRATFGRTWIKTGVKTDNQVHIGHNVVIGEHTLLVAQVGIAGSTTVGKHAVLAGQAGISGHLTIGDGTIVGPKTGVGRSLPDGEIFSGGSAAVPHRTWLRLQQIIPKLPDMYNGYRRMEKRIAELEQQLANKDR
ncbi:MAG: UDP-3-O-(3-hydroxymyristoyl)glucosamine N-acyltransferase [Desulfatitalea sp.]|nr:UDP-3-O-(3-hydroxymyristoyl)glucosamine N-acyltransferase [Desulfatitalea sp.]NNK01998.1 UDP-3-O-(3-hydroxymyristoyl)glucosamine N-acyltransferase [Desulfatitalea sp.]